MKIWYRIEVRDKDGKLLKRFKRRSRSYVRQWNDLVCVQMGPSTNRTIKDTGGTDRAILNYESNLNAEAGASTAAYGIVVGTGSTAVTISDNALASICAEGTGTDELNYLAVAVGAPSVSGSECSFTLTRIANNGSGATITIAEIGIYVQGRGAATYYFLGIRDVLASTIDVPDGGAITVEYTIKVTV